MVRFGNNCSNAFVETEKENSALRRTVDSSIVEKQFSIERYPGVSRLSGLKFIDSLQFRIHEISHWIFGFWKSWTGFLPDSCRILLDFSQEVRRFFEWNALRSECSRAYCIVLYCVLLYTFVCTIAPLVIYKAPITYGFD